MASARYWRIRCLGVENGGAPSIAKLEFRDAVSGTDLAMGGTPMASGSHPSYNVVNAFDADAATFWYPLTGAAPDAYTWVGYDFGSAVQIEEIAITARNADAIQTPTVFSVEYSTDNSTWLIEGIYTSGVYANSQTRTFTLGTGTYTGLSRFWELRLSNANGYIGLTEITFAAEVGGATICTGGAPFLYNTSINTGALAYAFNGNTTDEFVMANSVDQKKIGYCFPSNPEPIAEVRFRNRRWCCETQAPSGTDSFGIYKSDDGLTWTEVATFTPATWTAVLQEQSFDLPSAAGGGSTAAKLSLGLSIGL